MLTAHEIQILRSPQTIRDRAAQFLARAQAHQLKHFSVDLDRLDVVVDFVQTLTQSQYPTGEIPLHSRWRHFPPVALAQWSAASSARLSPIEHARACFELVIPSVLIDAGAGNAWRYVDRCGQTWTRSEGLAVASLELFEQGFFQPSQEASIEQLAAKLQVSSQNPIVGLAGRWQLLQDLRVQVQCAPQYFGSPGHLGHLVDYLVALPSPLRAEQILNTILESLGPIWAGGSIVAGVNLGDVWRYEDEWVPFHKLSQWLTYSLLEPLQALGLEITGLDALTGLAEYRNGGLFWDFGVLRPQGALSSVPYAIEAPLIIEWRALTVALLDLLADRMRDRLGLSAQQLPLVRVLQGGTWAAGRAIAKQLRPLGGSPIEIKSNATVF